MAAEWTWVFQREDDRLTISRSPDPDTTTLTVAADYGGSRLFSFATHAELVTFQTDLEQHLLGEGWRFAAFTPERRSEGGRRRATVSERRLLPFKPR